MKKLFFFKWIFLRKVFIVKEKIYSAYFRQYTYLFSIWKWYDAVQMQSLLARGVLENFETVFSIHSPLCAQCLVLIKLPRIGLMTQSLFPSGRRMWEAECEKQCMQLPLSVVLFKRHHMAHIGIISFCFSFFVQCWTCTCWAPTAKFRTSGFHRAAKEEPRFNSQQTWSN